MSTVEPAVVSTSPHRRGPAGRSAGLLLRVLPLLLAGCVGSDRVDDGVLLRPGGDVLAVDAVLDLSEDVTGDVMAAARDARFRGSVRGSYLGVGREQRVSGRIDGSVRAAGGSVRIDASVGRNVTAVGGHVELGPEASVEGNGYVAGGRVTLSGTVEGDLYVGAGELTLEGRIGGDVRAEVGSLTLGPDAVVDGELRVRMEEGAAPRIAPSARVSGGVVELEPRDDDGGDAAFMILRLMGFMLAGLVVVALLPGRALHAADEIRMHGAASLGYGLLALLLTPLAVLALAVTVVGIPLALILAVIYGLALYLAPVVPGVWLGSEILRGRSTGARRDTALVFLAGGAVVALALLLPWVGLVARALATCLGLGAVALLVRDGELGSRG